MKYANEHNGVAVHRAIDLPANGIKLLRYKFVIILITVLLNKFNNLFVIY